MGKFKIECMIYGILNTEDNVVIAFGTDEGKVKELFSNLGGDDSKKFILFKRTSGGMISFTGGEGEDKQFVPVKFLVYEIEQKLLSLEELVEVEKTKAVSL